MIVLFVYFSNLVPVFSNYYAFYYLVRDQFQVEENSKRTKRETDFLLKNNYNTDMRVSKDISDFLK